MNSTFICCVEERSRALVVRSGRGGSGAEMHSDGYAYGDRDADYDGEGEPEGEQESSTYASRPFGEESQTSHDAESYARDSAGFGALGSGEQGTDECGSNGQPLMFMRRTLDTIEELSSVCNSGVYQ